MTILGRLVIREATRAVRTAHQRRIRSLERELSQYSTAADRADLAATLDRYPDQQTTDLRTILMLQAMSTNQPTRLSPAPWRRPIS